jgi:hypothetical protein
MVRLLFLNVLAKGLRAAIGISDRYSAKTWNCAATLFFLFFCISVAPLLRNDAPRGSKEIPPITELSKLDVAATGWQVNADESRSVLNSHAHALLWKSMEQRIPTGRPSIPSAVVRPPSMPMLASGLSEITGAVGRSRSQTRAPLNSHSLSSTVPQTSQPAVPVNVYIQGPPAPRPDNTLVLWLAAIANAIGTLSSILFSCIANKRLHAEYLLKRLETEAKLKEMELRLLQLQQELDKARASPLILST